MTCVWQLGCSDLGGIAKIRELCRCVAVSELGETFVLVAVAQIDDKDLLDECGHLVGADGFPDFPGNGLGVIHATAENDIVTVHGAAALVFDAGAHHADVADVVLGAGILTTG